MIAAIIRTLIIYCAVTIFVRLMGKRQLGELQPGELVITLLASEIAASPILDNDLPILNSIIPLAVLVGFEILNSIINMKSVRFRYVSDGKPITVVRNGVIDQKQLKNLRYTTDDLLAALRQKDVFNVEDVEFAIVETTGMLSVLLKPEKRTSTPQNYDKPEKDTGIPCAVVVDGKIIQANFENCGITLEEIHSKIKRENIKLKDIMLMTVDKSKNYYVVMRKDI